jgi:hypothetical protein
VIGIHVRYPVLGTSTAPVQGAAPGEIVQLSTARPSKTPVRRPRAPARRDGGLNAPASATCPAASARVRWAAGWPGDNPGPRPARRRGPGAGGSAAGAQQVDEPAGHALRLLADIGQEVACVDALLEPFHQVTSLFAGPQPVAHGLPARDRPGRQMRGRDRARDGRAGLADAAREANAIPIPKDSADRAFAAAACIGALSWIGRGGGVLSLRTNLTAVRFVSALMAFAWCESLARHAYVVAMMIGDVLVFLRERRGSHPRMEPGGVPDHPTADEVVFVHGDRIEPITSTGTYVQVHPALPDHAGLRPRDRARPAVCVERAGT